MTFLKAALNAQRKARGEPELTTPDLIRRVNAAGETHMLMERSLYLGKNIPLNGTAHQAGTARFGTDPATSVLDLDCKAH